MDYLIKKNKTIGLKLYYNYYFRFLPHLFDYKMRNKKIYKNWLEKSDEDKYLCEALDSSTPLFFARYGSVELNTVTQYMLIRNGIKDDFDATIYKQVKNNAGFFPPCKNKIMEFGDFYLYCTRNVTDFAVWIGKLWQPYFVKNYSRPKRVFDAILTYSFDYEYIKHIKGKKVLIISPFAETIKKQYKKRKFIHPIKNCLVDFDLKVYKPVVSLADEMPEFVDWFEALNKMFNDVKDIDYDVVILSCGAYGLPLGSLLYEYKGKQVFHIGSSIQVLFGIRGGAYDNIEESKKLINDYWVYPSTTETPKGYEKVEGGAYWKPSANNKKN